MLTKCLFLASALAVAGAGLHAQATKDKEGSRDHPMISRFEGSFIIGFDQKEFDEYRLITGPMSGYLEGSDEYLPRLELERTLTDRISRRLEGEVWRLTYELPANRSTLEVIRNYQRQLTAAGFEMLFECANLECAGACQPKCRKGAFAELLVSRGGFRVGGSMEDDQRYFAARLTRPEGNIYVAALALGNLRQPMLRLDIVEVEPMEANLVTVSAATMAQEIASRGSVALYGIYFDHDKAELKPESRPTLAEIAKLLQGDPELSLFVVGHTDQTGALDYNLDLSRRRAEAVVSALSGAFGIAGGRLEAHGVGFLAPVASNTDEEGRSKNRRVQLQPRQP